MNELSMYSNGTCPHCGGPLMGDGYTVVLHCEFAEIPDSVEPDAGAVYCEADEPEAEE